MHYSVETMPTGSRPHTMRCMLIANLAVDQRFAKIKLMALSLE